MSNCEYTLSWSFNSIYLSIYLHNNIFNVEFILIPHVHRTLLTSKGLAQIQK